MLDLLPDLFDSYPNQLTLLPIPLTSFGAKSVFFGQVVTVRCFEDNSKVKELLNQDGTGRVLVVDGGGSTQKALMGDLIAESAVANGWQGVVINGAIRDVGAIAQMPLGVKALCMVPIKTERKGLGDINVTLELENTIIKPDMWIYADGNGIAVSDTELAITCDMG